MWDLSEKLCVVDIETTGLHPGPCAILTIGATIIGGGVLESKDSRFYGGCWPGEEYFENGKADRALAVNGLDIRWLEQQQSPEELADSFHSFLQANDVSRITSYNVRFDSKFLMLDPWFINSDYGMEWVACIMLGSQAAMGVKKWPKLTEAVEHFKISRRHKEHSALSDASVAADIIGAIELAESKRRR